MQTFLDFEKPIAELETKVEELRQLAKKSQNFSLHEELSRLETKAAKALLDVYAHLTPWQKTQVARHPQRPHFLDIANHVFQDFVQLSGDRFFAEDEAIIGGFAYFDKMPVCIVGHEKGADTYSRLRHNFGMARPEGYRKAIRLASLANKFHLPVISFIDTAGAFPGIDAEERGQAEAIARSTQTWLGLEVPALAIVIGEGGSGGALGIACANKIFMLEHAIYTVASPEASASILWRDSTKAQLAATSMKITAQDLLRFDIIDGIVEEPPGGAHRDHIGTFANIAACIKSALAGLRDLSKEKLIQERENRLLRIGLKP